MKTVRYFEVPTSGAASRSPEKQTAGAKLESRTAVLRIFEVRDQLAKSQLLRYNM